LAAASLYGAYEYIKDWKEVAKNKEFISTLNGLSQIEEWSQLINNYIIEEWSKFDEEKKWAILLATISKYLWLSPDMIWHYFEDISFDETEKKVKISFTEEWRQSEDLKIKLSESDHIIKSLLKELWYKRLTHNLWNTELESLTQLN
jgi:hypothetical protein